jgi:hypothetical protein
MECGIAADKAWRWIVAKLYESAVARFRGESDQHVECSCRELCLSYEPTHPSFTNNPLHLLK